MMQDGFFGRWIWPLLASLAGAVTALSFRPFARMSKVEIFMALFVGASFSFFVGPIAFRSMAGPDGTVDMRLTGAVFYLMASGSNLLIPFMIKKLGVNIGYRDPEEKP